MRGTKKEIGGGIILFSIHSGRTSSVCEGGGSHRIKALSDGGLPRSSEGVYHLGPCPKPKSERWVCERMPILVFIDSRVPQWTIPSRRFCWNFCR
ncbi:hypothetical protein TNCV_2654511 [Trichonephila clavipes]|nr:hypothetical protein TNCV_2654511 [Trichonephila clavipes]